MKLGMIVFVGLALLLGGCERHYSVLTEEGIVDMPLSKALKTAETPQQLYPMLSEAADIKDRHRIETRIEQLQGVSLSNEPRNYSNRDDYLAKQAERRIKYVKSNFLDDDMKETILSGGIAVNMTKNEFIASCGQPTDTKTVETEQGEAQVLTMGIFNKCCYYFIDDKLAYWF